MLKRFAAVLLAMLLVSAQAFAGERAQLRAAWQQISSLRTDASPYLEQPDPESFSAGALTDAAQKDALNCLNFLRGIAGLDPVGLNPIYTLRAQNGAMLLAANDQLEHNAPQPIGMNPDQYESAHMGTSMGNIAKFNWMKPDILAEGVTYFARDDGEANLSVLGHRRWLLNPYMAETGFGLANSASGMSYVTMYAVDDGNAGAEWDHVAWPAPGLFPVELMRAQLPWSVSLNDSVYDLSASRIRIQLTETVSGTAFSFDLRSGGDGFCCLSEELCGAGSCIIFRPDFPGEYEQNQSWAVKITGLRRTDGSDAEIRYVCDMVSLYPQDVANIELSRLEAQLAPGEPLLLTAAVIPAYADDLSLSWTSSDPTVATVSDTGAVLAVSPGECTITAESANGRSDCCKIIVE